MEAKKEMGKPHEPIKKNTKHITQHANGETLLKRSCSHSHSFPVLQHFCLFGLQQHGSALISKASSKVNSTILTDRFV